MRRATGQTGGFANHNPVCAMTTFHTITAPELARMLEQEPPLLLDVRNEDEVQPHGLIPGARHIPLPSLAERAGELPVSDQPLVIYCHAGVRSAHACAYLATLGHPNLFNLQGGVIAWGNAGYGFVPKA